MDIRCPPTHNTKEEISPHGLRSFETWNHTLLFHNGIQTTMYVCTKICMDKGC
jgi:hypothetical protein